MTATICPYCGVAPADSKDHIFSKFLGGRRTIPACRRCNNRTFGSGFEAAVKCDLEPMMVALAINGLSPTTTVRWAKARTDPETGWVYDLNPNGEFSPSRIYVEKDAEGRISRYVMHDDAKLANKQAASLIKSGQAQQVQQEVIREPFTRSLPVHFNFGDEVRQLAVKMCVATAQLELADGQHNVLDIATRAYLLQGKSPSSAPPVKIAFSRYAGLDKLRPPLSHVVYVEADTVDKKCYGVVQFYGAIQFYIILNAQYSGKDFARIGFVNRHPELSKECFEIINPLHLTEPPDTLFTDELPDLEQGWFRKLNDEVRALFGKNELLIGSPDRPRLSV